VVVDSLTYAGNLENLNPHLQNGSITFKNASILDTVEILPLVRDTDCIVHFAAETHVDRSINNPDIFLETNVVGTHNLVKLATEFDKRIIVISTDEVYGSISKGSATEKDNLNPSSPYSSSKAAADLLSLAYFKTYGTKVVITRCTNNYGTRQYPEKLIPFAIRKLIRGEKIGVYGDGMNIRDWIHVRDHVDGVVKSMIYGTIGEIYNFGGNNEISNIALINQMLRILGKSDNLVEFIEDRLGHDFRYSLDTTKAQRELNWYPIYNFEDEFVHLVKWYEEYFRSS